MARPDRNQNRLSNLTAARNACQTVDLVIMMLVEKLRHSGERAYPLSVSAQIQGAPIGAIRIQLERLTNEVKVLDRSPVSYALNQLGVEVLLAEIEGFQPSAFEQHRRDQMNAAANAGAMRS